MTVAAPIRRVSRFTIGLFFGLVAMVGSLLVTDYGISWDEPTDHRNGLVSVRYVADLVAPAWAARQPVLQGLPPFESNLDNDHGVLFEMPLALLHVLQPGLDLGTFYQLRHFGVFLVTLGSLWFLFRLAVLRFRDERLGLLVVALFLASPRFFAESFYNGKDLVFLALFTTGTYTLARLLARPTLGRAALHGLATAAAIDVRILGLLLVPATFVLLAVPGPSERLTALFRRLIRVAACYAGVTLVATIAGWPYLWEHPLQHFLLAGRHMSHFPWVGQVLYLGELYWANGLPWHYAPVWIGLTTPGAYLLAAAVGLAAISYRLLSRPLPFLRTLSGRLDVLLIGWLVAPLLLVMVLHSVLYDGWRHLYFVYPALLLLAVRGGLALHRAAQPLPRWRSLARVAAVVAVLEVLVTVGRMVRMHPFEHVYFNYLTPAQAERLFERDYWGLSFRQGLEWLVRQRPTGTIPVDVSHLPLLENNKLLLSAADRQRLTLDPPAAGRYFITAHRIVGHRSLSQLYADSLGQEVFAIRADGARILTIFWRQQGQPLAQPVPHNQGK
ncbi:hypothetical protein [Hymenobacter glacieicola]|nr:hypothetical protein [Hymenobacter glacieicola]